LDRPIIDWHLTIFHPLVSDHPHPPSPSLARRQSARDSFADDLFKDMATLKRYVAYARATCHPCLSQAAHEMLANYYVSVREQMRKQAIESGASVIPITVRQLEAIIRISESLARMQLEAVATVDHVTEAIRLFQVRACILACSRAGRGDFLYPVHGLTDSDGVDSRLTSPVRVF
jgi:DNA replicative helicase MCM subunit Mcm2 (Cdc46/Mcm family)